VAKDNQRRNMEISLYNLVATMIQNTDQTMDDVSDVLLNHPTDPTKITVTFRDGTEAVIELSRPRH
jgi:hypothetical protein